jgi:hypothetical protein
MASAALSRSRSEVGYPIHYGHHDLSFAKILISKVISNTKKDKQRAETNALNLKPDKVNVRLWYGRLKPKAFTRIPWKLQG